MEDRKLYQEFLEGSLRAFDEIVLSYKNGLISFIMRYVRDIQMAEDISQDVFVALYLNKEKYNFKYALKTYIYTIGKYKAINYLKKIKHEKNIEELEVENGQNLEEDFLISEQNRETIQLLKRLNNNYGIVLYLADIEGLTYQEISKITNKTLSQVKVNLHRARKALKLILEKEGKKNA